nr:general secretion pathway protein GspB [Vibrio agarilyticus]
MVQPTAPNLLYIVTQDGARSALVDGELNDVESLPLPEFGELVRAPQRDILTTPNNTASVLAPSAERLEQASSAESKPFVIAANDSQEASLPSLNDLDLSSLSPELVARLENARVFDEPSELEDASHTASEEDNHGAVIELERQAAQWQGRLPPLNLQTHLYAGDPSKRWVKINGREFRQQEWISSQLQLVEIQPQRVVVAFDGVKISLPALYEWQG